MEQITYEWIRSRRRTIAIQVKADGQVIVRSPYSISKNQIDQFVKEKRAWILRQQEELQNAREKKTVITEEMRRQGVRKALEHIPERVAYYASIMGVSYGRITIREQKTRWGSCSDKGNLNFNWKLVLMPEEVLDYVVVHELAHRKEMNHSKEFWKIVEKVFPDYKERRKTLTEMGKQLS
ncbi:M48 family metallopeptidase [Bariatricus sp. SGI.154]|uniref:M48 family metallopeptidase n=1 Tax=Bariatricus sp. SGI.154 TaxID=3420549 RepID=UPI003CFCBFC9